MKEDHPRWSPKPGTRYNPRRIPSMEPEKATKPIVARDLLFAIALSASLCIVFNPLIV
jgi:hypothetical protein